MTAPEYEKLVARKFWKAWIPMSVAGFGLIFLALYLLGNFQLQKKDAELRVVLKQVDDHINEHFRDIISDLEFLVNNPVTEDFVDYPESIVEKALVQSLFLRMAESHPDYDQIRLLSKSGSEIIRINNDDGIANVVSAEHLQDKSDRYYYKEASALKPGGIYISRFDLNVENGVVEVPHKPVLRFIAPVIGVNRDTLGYVVLNLKGNVILHQLHKIMRSHDGEHFLFNQAGYLLHSQNEADPLWGFMFESSAESKEFASDEHRKMMISEFGEFSSALGRVHYRVANKKYSADNASLKNGLKPWLVMFRTDDSYLNSNFLQEHLKYLFPLLIVFPLGTFVLYYWANAAAGRSIAEGELKHINSRLESKVADRTRELELTREATILSLATLAETRDNETGQHIRRTQRYAELLSRVLSQTEDFESIIDDSFINEIYRSAPLHDIGKVGISDQILLKTGRLTTEEFKEMQQHTVLGSNALEEAIVTISASKQSGTSLTFLHMARDIAHYHHERWDGSGYPKGLAGEGIPLCARVMAIVDVYDALVSERVYKEAFSKEKAERIILEQSEGQFDPRILKAFESVKDQFWEIRRNFSDLS